MGKNKSIFKRHSKIPSVFLCLNFLLFLSCGLNSPKSVLSTSHLNQESEPKMIVQKFMNYVSENKIEKANNLVITEKGFSSKADSTQELPPKFDWAKTFIDRKLSLGKVEESKTSKDNAKVKATVIHDNDSRITMTTIFDLKNVDGQWFIYDIEFITNKNQIPDKFL